MTDIICIILIVYLFLNYKLYIVSSGSMEPSLKINELILVQKNGIYSVGDIISFYDNTMQFPVTHRIVKIDNDKYYTKGDYNNIQDPIPVLKSSIIGKVVWKSYYLGLLYVNFRYQLLFIFILIFILINLISFNKSNNIKHFHIFNVKKGAL